MKKLLNFGIILLASSGWLMAQPPRGMGKSDPDAKKILDAVSAKFKTYKTVQSKFNLKVENISGVNKGSKNGTLFMKGTKYRVSVPGQEIFSDGSNTWTYDKNANEVTITRYDPSSGSITPQKMFTNFYDKDFLYKLNGEKKSGAKTIQEVELTPIDKSRNFDKVVVNIDKAGQFINSTKVFEKAGNRYTISVNSLLTNKSIDENMFVFDQKKYPGVEVVDLR
jgi:outer membrane lipoprotein-sorting protein